MDCQNVNLWPKVGNVEEGVLHGSHSNAGEVVTSDRKGPWCCLSLNIYHRKTYCSLCWERETDGQRLTKLPK
jgi:hypothetical protein